MRKKLRVCMAGMGRTGREIALAVIGAEDMELVMGVCGGHNPRLGEDMGTICGVEPIGVSLMDSEGLEEVIAEAKPDVVIDFTTPDAVMRNAKIFAVNGVCMVIGTTGFTEVQQIRLKSLAVKHGVGIVLAPNITLGVNVLMTLVNLAATILEDYDGSVVETHFKNKKDKPSGTALKIAEQIRLGIEARQDKPAEDDVPIYAIRSGGVIGRHSVVMAGEFDRLEIAHESFSRKTFAVGALRAARFVAGKSGCFEMRDVLNMEEALAAYYRGPHGTAAREKLARAEVL